ncbi:MAG: SDR family NAD(P)-dependent oxidoreductase [Eubacterium sp.]|nr:SDR family NAD(P)-dependent oxidoreductase [Eubacterium sp.]MDD7209561.1 SDR family NAD(P)-dependent oxidoreductase [Lachnospiraceae bacterium]MDY5498445.1 SDR family NAD(P)-dependent oxidoreductase [Anaerobutyricum sp.]
MKIGVITGASSGMGKEFVKIIMQDKTKGMDEIWVIARRRERLEMWPKLYRKQKFRIFPLDLSQKKDLEFLKKTVEEEKPQVELLIHCAGFGIMGKIDELSMEEQEEMVDVNCRSVTEVTSIFLPYMEEGGRMIYMASAAAFLPQPGFAVYAAGKAFVLSYVRALRAENRHRNLKITAVCPGAVKTEFFNRALEKRHLPAYKKLVMADPKRVVKKAWKDNLKNKELSVYGKAIQLTRLAAKILPHSVFLQFMGRK